MILFFPKIRSEVHVPAQRHVTNPPRSFRTGSAKPRPMPGRASIGRVNPTNDRATCYLGAAMYILPPPHRTGLYRSSQKLPPLASRCLYTGRGRNPPPPNLAIKAVINNRAGIFKMFGCA